MIIIQCFFCILYFALQTQSCVNKMFINNQFKSLKFQLKLDKQELCSQKAGSPSRTESLTPCKAFVSCYCELLLPWWYGEAEICSSKHIWQWLIVKPAIHKLSEMFTFLTNMQTQTQWLDFWIESHIQWLLRLYNSMNPVPFIRQYTSRETVF